MKNRVPIMTARLIVVGLLAVATFACIEQKTLAAEPPVDPATHAKHVAAGAMPPDAAKGDPALSQQVSELQAKVAQLEAALARKAPLPPDVAAPAAGAMPGMAAPAAPMADMKSAAPAPMAGADGMGGMAAPPGGTMNKMAMMEKMMGMMDKMMSMDDGAMPAGAPMAGGMGMEMMPSEKGGMGAGAMPAGAPAAGMSGGGGMGMDKMEMAGMMGMGPMNGGAGKMPQFVLPGFPGASHLYHIGATGFFLDHPQHITLTTEQQAGLNKAKEQALLAKSTADRAIAQAEQDLWTLTASDQPDATKIEAQVQEIEKLRGNQRLNFIRAVGEAAKVLTDEQRKSLLGEPPPQNQGSQPAPGGIGSDGMRDM